MLCIFNVLHTVFLLNNYHRHHYYFIVVFLENSENDSKLTDVHGLTFDFLTPNPKQTVYVKLWFDVQ